MDAEALFDDMTAELSVRGASPGAMFGARSLTLGRKVFATTKNGRVTVKLGSGTAVQERALEIGTPDDPSGKGRPMKDWVTFDADQDADEVGALIDAAFELAKKRA